MAIIYLMCGIPGSGKSTYAKSHMNPSTDIYVSRDKIRFSNLKENDFYFSHETTVYNTFTQQIKTAFLKGNNVWADATHLTAASRARLINSLNIGKNHVIVIFVDTPINICIERNEARKGLKKVPIEVIQRMRNSLEIPNDDEGYAEVKYVRGNE